MVSLYVEGAPLVVCLLEFLCTGECKTTAVSMIAPAEYYRVGFRVIASLGTNRRAMTVQQYRESDQCPTGCCGIFGFFRAYSTVRRVFGTVVHQSPMCNPSGPSSYLYKYGSSVWPSNSMNCVAITHAFRSL